MCVQKKIMNHRTKLAGSIAHLQCVAFYENRLFFSLFLGLEKPTCYDLAFYYQLKSHNEISEL